MQDVILKPMTESDLEIARIWRNSPEIGQYMYTDTHVTPEQQQIWFENISRDNTRKYYMITYNETPKGVAFLYNISPLFHSCYWAFYLGDTSDRGIGLGSKTEFHMLSLVFDTLNLNKLSCEVFVENAKVIQMHERFGFRRESYFRQHIYKREKYHDVVGLALLKSEWEILKPYHHQRIYNS